jgi:hypothetical protein
MIRQSLILRILDEPKLSYAPIDDPLSSLSFRSDPNDIDFFSILIGSSLSSQT